MKYYGLIDSGGRTIDPGGDSWVNVPLWLCHEFPFDEGVRIEDWDSRTLVFVDRRGPLRDFPDSALGNHIMSAKLQEVISAVAPDTLQFLPIRMLSSIGDEVATGYALSNYLIWCDAVDRKRSVPGEGRKRVVKDEDGDYDLDKLVLDPKKIIAPIFRVNGVDDVFVYREDVVERIQQIGATGIAFEAIES
ncbi:MAG TPA: DUF1629 domain-containing protein [Planctomycetaceae bacterium]|jgi:hypothetical protein|nr:DUF1629 domain-containing protein [Planctomycetaceae bacterium]